MQTKKIMCVFLCLTMLVGTLAGCGTETPPTQESSTPTTPPTAIPSDTSADPSAEPIAPESTEPPMVVEYDDPELMRAVTLGIVSDEFLKDAEKECTYKDVYDVLQNVIKIRKPDKTEELQTKMVPKDDVTATMYGCFIAAYYAAQVIDGIPSDNAGTATSFSAFTDPPMDSEYYPDLQNWIDAGDKMDFDVFPGIWEDPNHSYNFISGEQEGIYGPRDCGSVPMAAYLYCNGLASYFSHNRVFPLDENFYGMEYGVAVSHEELALIAVRFYDSFMDEDYVSLDQLAGEQPITAEEIANAPQLPTPTKEKLPAEWRGVCIDEIGQTWFNPGHYIAEPYESDFKFMSENNINFARVVLTCSWLQAPDYSRGMYEINRVQLDELDNIIRWGLKYGVHIQFSFTGLPGRGDTPVGTHERVLQTGHLSYDTAYGDEFYPTDEEWTAMLKYQQMIAARYANVPTSYLTLDLGNEFSAQGNAERANEFAQHYCDIADAIWEVSPDRVLLISDTASLTDPLDREMYGAILEHGVCLGYHSYGPEEILNTHSNPVPDATWPYTDSAGKTWDMEEVYQSHILYAKELADEKGVGFMVNEIGILSTVPQQFYLDYHSDVLATMDKYEIPFSYFILTSEYAFINEHPKFSWRDGASVEKITYDMGDYIYTFFCDPELVVATFGAKE